jgi:ferredoxin-NADP reductase
VALDPAPVIDDEATLVAPSAGEAVVVHLSAPDPAVEVAAAEAPLGATRVTAAARPTGGAVVALGQLLDPPGPRPSRRGPTGPIGSLRTPSTTLVAPLADPAAPPEGDPAPTATGPATAEPPSSAPRLTGPTPAPPTDGPALSGPPGQILEIVDVGPSVRIFKVGRPAGLTFTGGQYLKAGIDAVRTASFSLASAPYETHLELCVELIPGGRLTPQLFALRPGSSLTLGNQVKGSFTLDTAGHTHLMVATVTGIAPLRSMLRQALHDGTNDRFVILHGASYADELPYHGELVALAATDRRVAYVPTVSRPAEARNAGWTGQTGRVDPLASNVAVTLDRSDLRAYACGNPGMVSTVTSDLRALGIPVSSETFD